MQDWLAHRARTTPTREALVNASSGNSWTYATLNETVEEMAGRLAALGVEADDHLGAVMASGVEEVCLIHAAMRLGAVLAPLPPEFTPPELAERFDRADVDAVVCDAGTESQVREAVERADAHLSVCSIDETDADDASSLAAAEPTEFSPAEWERGDSQLLLFTSGTTGTAKAVELTMGNLLASAAASAFRLGVDPEDRWLVPLSLHHMGGIAPVLRSTLYGTTVVVRESFDPGGTVDDLREYDATCVSLVPTMLRRMLSARGTLPDSLRFVLVGGAPCPAELIARCRDYSVPISPTYGMTETASQVATARHREAYDHPESVGRPLLWTDVTVVDDDGEPVGPGETGELVVSGPTVTPGYYGDPAATREAMGTHGLHTGDVGYRDERGRLYVMNRLDDRILSGGENVDPGEVVDALRAHQSVREAAVVGLDDEEWGEQVAALLVPADDAEIDLDELEAFLRERLAGFKLPRTVGIVEALPRTVSGTVERDAVRERLQEGETVSLGGEGATDSLTFEPEDDRALPRGEGADEADPADADDDADLPVDREPELPAEQASPEEGATPDSERPLLDAADVDEAAESTDGAVDVDDRAEPTSADEADEPESRRGGSPLSPSATDEEQSTSAEGEDGLDGDGADDGGSDDGDAESDDMTDDPREDA